MNNSTCGILYWPALAVLSTTNVATLVTCIFVLVLVWYLDLYRKTVYRLALYQVLAALEAAAVLVAQIQFKNYDSSDRRMCVATAYFLLQSQWTKLLLVVCITIHLFCYAVFHKNLKRFELLYLLSSVLLPFLIAAIPLTTDTYGLAGSWCWIQDGNDDCSTPYGHTVIQQFVLWTVPSIIILLMTSVAMVAMVIIVAKRSCPDRSSESISITGRYQNRKALKQLLPLAAYPILFCVFIVLPFSNIVFEAKDIDNMERVFEVGAALSNAGWGLTTALVLVAHIAVVKCSRQNKIKAESAIEYRYMSAPAARV